MSINNDYAKRYLNMVTTNVVGHCGIKLQVKGRDNNGKFDSEGNRTIEEAFMEWSKKENKCRHFGLMFMLKKTVLGIRIISG